MIDRKVKDELNVNSFYYLCSVFYIHIYLPSDYIFRRILLGYYAEGMHANFKENLV